MNGTTAYTGITYVIPCGAAKLDAPAPARDLYTGAMFRHTLAAAEAAAEGDEQARILILSAEHGLIGLDEIVAPYDRKMGQPGSVTAERIAAQAAALGIGWRAEVDAFLPRAYFQVLDEALKTLHVYAREVYEFTAGIGEQRGVNRTVTLAA